MTRSKKPIKPKTVSKPASKPAKGKAEKPAREQRNGVTRPGTDTVCNVIWLALDQMNAAGTEYTYEALRELVDDARGKRPAADDTLKTQRQRWKVFNA